MRVRPALPWLLLLVAVHVRATPPPGVVRASALELVDREGAVVASLRTRDDGGVELVLGGPHQASLLTTASGAHLNLVGDGALIRVQATDRPRMTIRPQPGPGSDPVEHGDVGPPEAGYRRPDGDAAAAGLDPPR